MSDANDKRLLEDGRIDVLLAKYRPVVVARCVARLKGHPDAEDVAHRALLRLLEEFHRHAGAGYRGLPYRVVVHQVTTWTIKDHFAGRPTDAPLPEDWLDASNDLDAQVLVPLTLEQAFEELPKRERDVCTLRYIDLLEPDEIASKLGITRNNVYQALWRGHQRLRDLFDDA